MAKADYLRQSSIINIKDFQDNRIGIVGCGAIGSFVGISLAKMGLIRFVLWDFDKIEPHNLPNQFFTESDNGMNKAVALREHMHSFNSDVAVMHIQDKFTAKSSLKGCQIVVSAVDKMDVRKTILNRALKDGCQFLIDSRMAKFQGQIYSINLKDKDDVKNYRKTLFKNSEGVRLRCTERSIIFTVLGIASMVCNQIIKAFNNEEFPNYIVLDYSVPQMM